MKISWMKGLTAAGLLAVLAVAGCRRENGIDNNNVIRTPYGVYAVDREGIVLNTNDGENFSTIFPADGFSPRSIVVTGLNILMVKTNVFLSEDNGMNFNPTFINLPPNPNLVYLPANPASLYQGMMLEVPSHSRTYLASTAGYGDVYTEDYGKTWTIDSTWDTSITNHYIPTVDYFAQLANGGDLFAWNNRDTALYVRSGGASGKWLQVKTNGLPRVDHYYLSRINTTLLLTDSTGANGVRLSTDGGQNWTAYFGLPQHKLFSTYAPFDQTLLVGTDSSGIYRLESGSFLPSNGGLAPNTSVYAIIGKENTFKNDVVKKYVYIGTNTGLYRSEDGGLNWVKMVDGWFTRLY